MVSREKDQRRSKIYFIFGELVAVVNRAKKRQKQKIRKTTSDCKTGKRGKEIPGDGQRRDVVSDGGGMRLAMR